MSTTQDKIINDAFDRIIQYLEENKDKEFLKELDQQLKEGEE